MKIIFRYYEGDHYIPVKKEVEVPDHSTIESAMAYLNLRFDYGPVISLNSKHAVPGKRLKSKDVIHLYPPLLGG